LYAFLDWTLTRPALLSGERIADLVAAVEGNAERFEDLVRPYRAIGADVETGERVSMGTGSILQATRASAAVPIIWPPVRWQDRMLIDGSMIDPVPGEVVREMGADLCIAVNVVPPLRRGVETVISRWSRRFSRFNPLSHMGDAVGMPNMLDIFMNTIQMLQRELGDYKAIAADVRIHPDLSDFTWIEFYRSKELIERGIEAAQQAVPEVRRLLNARLAQGPRARTIPNFDLADRVDHPQTGAQQLPGGVHAQ
jgi:NTE family protein